MCPVLPLAVVLVLAVVLILVVVLVVVLVLILVVLILILVLVIHSKILRIFIFYGSAARLGYPKYQALSFALKMKPTSKPQNTAAVIPPAQAFSPPVRMPRKPLWSTASRTPLAKL